MPLCEDDKLFMLYTAYLPRTLVQVDDGSPHAPTKDQLEAAACKRAIDRAKVAYKHWQQQQKDLARQRVWNWKVGDTLVFIGLDGEPMTGYYAEKVLTLGKEYVVRAIEPHGMVDMLWLEGTEAGPFNKQCFEVGA